MRKVLILTLLTAFLVSAAIFSPLMVSAGEKVVICHKPGTPAETTIEVSVNAEPAHLAHGDYQGACPGQQNTCPVEFTYATVANGESLSIDLISPAGAWNFDLGTVCSGKQIMINGSLLAGKQGLYLTPDTHTYEFVNDNNDNGNPIDIYWVCWDSNGPLPEVPEPPACP